MIRATVGFLTLLVLMSALQARDKPESTTPEQQYQKLVKEYDTAREEFQKAYKQAKTPQDRSKVIQEKYPQPEKFAPRFLKLAEKNPKDPAALDALIWVVANTSGSRGAAESPRVEAMKLLLRHHLQSKKMASVCQSLR
ncbi:MAG: hypothetical protein ACRELG_16955, partial [Gemmataceae bacterium]